jgi:hypothetical protein
MAAPVPIVPESWPQKALPTNARVRREEECNWISIASNVTLSSSLWRTATVMRALLLRSFLRTSKGQECSKERPAFVPGDRARPKKRWPGNE